MSGLELIGLHAGYGRTMIVRGLDLLVPFGRVVGLAGRNGVGKTTSLRAISNIATRISGTVLLDGAELKGGSASIARRGVSHVPEGRGVVPSFTVEENLKLGCIAVGKSWSDELLGELLQTFPQLEPLRTRHAGLLSGGEQQLLAIARGLAAKPRILMIDELSLGLSPKATELAMNLVSRLCRETGVGLLMVDQNIQALAAHSDDLYHMNDAGTARPLERGSDWESELNRIYF